MANKMTYSTALSTAIEALRATNATQEVIDKVIALKASVDKKNASPKKLTAQQEKNEALKAEILDFLGEHEGEGFTVTDLIKSVPALEGDSNQHVSALLRQLCQANAVDRYSEKRRTYFKAAE